MNSYLNAINHRDMISQKPQIEKGNFYQKSNEYKFNIDAMNKQIISSNDYENNSTNLNTDSPMTDVSIPSPPSSLNLVSLSRCPSPPAPLTVNPYVIKNDFASIASDETNQTKTLFYDKLSSDFSHEAFRRQFLPNTNTEAEIEASLLSSINFIRFYLDRFDTKDESNKQTNFQRSDSQRDYIINQNMKILNDYLSRSNAEEIIENTIELIKNFKPLLIDKPKF